ncbi:MAG: GNAT family acetyltransferase [Rhodoglobus sp.]
MDMRAFVEADTDAVVQLWENCELTRPWNDPRKDIARKRTVQPDLFLVGEVDGQLVATAMFGYDGHRGWVNYLAVSPAMRGRGLGRELMARGEELLTAAGCPKLSLLVRSGNDVALGFYRALGYEVDPVLALGKRLIADSAG